MGWLGWTLEVSLATDVNAVVIALDSRSELIGMIFGDGKKRGKKGKKKGNIAQRFKLFVEQHNRGKRNLDG